MLIWPCARTTEGASLDGAAPAGLAGGAASGGSVLGSRLRPTEWGCIVIWSDLEEASADRVIAEQVDFPWSRPEVRVEVVRL